MVGFDIGGTKCAVITGKEENGKITVTGKKVIPTDLSASPYEMIDKMAKALEKLPDDGSLIGVSCGGPLDTKKGIITSPPNLPGWDDVRVKDYLLKKYKRRSRLQNDADACAVAEWKYGAGKGARNMVFLTFGTGMGAGLILNGKLYSGACDMAGEVGHIRLSQKGPRGYGKSGSFEGFCSGGGIARAGVDAAEKAFKKGEKVSFCKCPEDINKITAKLIAEKASAGEKDALLIFDKCGEKLGEALSVFIDVLNPELIVIGSIFARCEKLLRPSMERVIKKEALSLNAAACRIVPAALGESIGDIAALSLSE